MKIIDSINHQQLSILFIHILLNYRYLTIKGKIEKTLEIEIFDKIGFSHMYNLFGLYLDKLDTNNDYITDFIYYLIPNTIFKLLVKDKRNNILISIYYFCFLMIYLCKTPKIYYYQNFTQKNNIDIFYHKIHSFFVKVLVIVSVIHKIKSQNKLKYYSLFIDMLTLIYKYHNDYNYENIKYPNKNQIQDTNKVLYYCEYIYLINNTIFNLFVNNHKIT